MQIRCAVERFPAARLRDLVTRTDRAARAWIVSQRSTERRIDMQLAIVVGAVVSELELERRAPRTTPDGQIVEMQRTLHGADGRMGMTSCSSASRSTASRSMCQSASAMSGTARGATSGRTKSGASSTAGAAAGASAWREARVGVTGSAVRPWCSNASSSAATKTPRTESNRRGIAGQRPRKHPGQRIDVGAGKAKVPTASAPTPVTRRATQVFVTSAGDAEEICAVIPGEAGDAIGGRYRAAARARDTDALERRARPIP